MTPGRRRPTGPPPSAGVLARYAQAHAREVGVAEGRVRAWVAYMIMAGALERPIGAAGPRFILKGGVALELRLRERARATKDIDVVLRDAEADLSDALEQAVTGDADQGFSFRREVAVLQQAIDDLRDPAMPVHARAGAAAFFRLPPQNLWVKV